MSLGIDNEVDFGPGISMVLLRQYNVIVGATITRMMSRSAYRLILMRRNEMRSRVSLNPWRLPA